MTHLRGETGAQSTIIPSLDAVLGIVHKQDMLRVMLKELEAYRPRPHRQFLGFLRSVMWGPAGEGDVAGPESKDAHHLLRDYVQASGSRALVRAYNRVVANVWAFRAIHVTFADAYIARYTSRENATGGTPYKAYLRKHRDESGAGQVGSRCRFAAAGVDDDDAGADSRSARWTLPCRWSMGQEGKKISF